MRPDTLAALVTDRQAGRLDTGACVSRLDAAGFTDAGAALSALDDLISSAHPDLSATELLQGAAEAADPQRALFNASRLAVAAREQRCGVPAHELATFLGASQHMADLLVSRPTLLDTLGQRFDAEAARTRYREAGAGDDREQALRHAQQEDLLAIGWHDLVGGNDVEQVTLQLSRLADAAVAGAALGIGADRHFAIIALGKLGGLELNYSSDIDLIFVRPDSATDQASADRVARALVQLVGKQTPEGHLYRVDMRLRPEGSSGALTRTLSSCMEYYERIGRPWERQMLTKARLLFESDGAGAGFLELTREWILSCGMDAGAILQFKRLKAATEAHHRADDDELADVKQAPGGIRDIETIVQFLSLMHASDNPGLLSASTLRGLERLRVAGAISTLEASRLRAAYRFHREVENLLQVMHRVQTHRLPGARTPLARLMGSPDSASLDATLSKHRTRVREIFNRHFAMAFRDLEGPAAEVSELVLAGCPDGDLSLATLSTLGFSRAQATLDVLRRAAAPVSRFLPATPRLRTAFASVAPALLDRLALAPDPDAALDRFESVTRGVGAREVLYTRLGQEPTLLAMLCDLCGASSWLTDLLTSEAHIFDDFIDALYTGVRGRRKRRSLLEGMERAPNADPWLVLSDYQKLETLLIGAHDLQDSVPIRQTLSELSHLCIDILRHALDVVMSRMVREHGQPFSIRGVSGRASAGMVVVALGKVGALEANYASDADLVFVYSADGETETGMPNSVFFTRVAEELIARVGGGRGGARLYKIDTRLRPEGEKGQLVTPLRAFEAYYNSPRAALFERQALLRARVVAGDAELGQKVLSVLRATVRGVGEPEELASRMREMRARIEAETKTKGLDLKRGPGGVVDVEFVTQFLQLREGDRLPALLVQETSRALEMLAELDVMPKHTAHAFRDAYLFFRRVETRLQIALGLDTKEVPRDPAAARELALRLGYADTAEGNAGHQLLVDLETATQETRKRYDDWLR